MSMEFAGWRKQVQSGMEGVLAAHLPSLDVVPQKLHEAMHYAAMDGGKRVRPLLVYAAGELFDAPRDAIARAAAALDGAPNVQPAHLEDLCDVLWTDPEQADKASDIVTRIANPTGAKISEILRAVNDTLRSTAPEAAARMASIKKLEESEREIGRLIATGNGRAKAAANYIRGERVRMQAAALGIDPAKAAALLGGGAA